MNSPFFYHTHGLDCFYNGKTQRAERGLECSVITVDLAQYTGYTLSAQQTEADLALAQGEDTEQKSRVDFYLGHLAYSQSYFPQKVR